MKLEQSIQRSSKSSIGIIGEKRSLSYTTKWCLTYHEVLGIKDAFRDILHPVQSAETNIHHGLAKSSIIKFNTAVSKMKSFISERENPYLLGDTSKKLKNISNQVVSTPSVAEQHLKFPHLSKKKFDTFHNSVFVERT